MLIKTKVFPGAKKDLVEQRETDHFYIHTTEPRSDGRATTSARTLLARHLHIPINKLRLVRGQTSQNKLFEVIKV